MNTKAVRIHGKNDLRLDDIVLPEVGPDDVQVRIICDSVCMSTYKAALEMLMDWGVEVPTYQRQEATLVSTERVNVDSIPGDLTPYYGWLAEVHTLEMN